MAEAEKFWNGYKDETGRWRQGYTTLNATGEDMLDSKLYIDSALNRRCVMLIEGFYEWYHHYPMGKKGERLKTAVKYPHHIFIKDNPHHFMMVAGIWNPWRHQEVNETTGQPETLTTPTFAISTSPANALCARIHNSKKRMPTVLTKELAEEWMQDELSEERIREIATFQYPAEQMDAYTVAKDFQQITSPKTKHFYSELETEFC